MRVAGLYLKGQTICWPVVETRNQSTAMEPENLDIEQINEDRRKAIQQNIEVISVDDLKSAWRKAFSLRRSPLEGEVLRVHRRTFQRHMLSCHHQRWGGGSLLSRD